MCLLLTITRHCVLKVFTALGRDDRMKTLILQIVKQRLLAITEPPRDVVLAVLSLLR